MSEIAGLDPWIVSYSSTRCQYIVRHGEIEIIPTRNLVPSYDERAHVLKLCEALNRIYESNSKGQRDEA